MKHQQEVIDVNTPLDFNREKIKIRNDFVIGSILSLIQQLVLIAFILTIVILVILHKWGFSSWFILLVFWVPINMLFGMFIRCLVKDVDSILKALSWQYDIKNESIALFNTARIFIFTPFSLVSSICFIVLYVKWNYITATSKSDNNIKITNSIDDKNETLSNETNEDMFNSWKPNDDIQH